MPPVEITPTLFRVNIARIHSFFNRVPTPIVILGLKKKSGDVTLCANIRKTHRRLLRNDRFPGRWCIDNFFRTEKKFPPGEVFRKAGVAVESSTNRLDLLKEFPSRAFPVVPLGRSVWRNGLAVRMPNHLGDAVMALPALAAIKKILPECCALYVIAPTGHRDLYTSLNIVDGIITLSRLHHFWRRGELLDLYKMRFGVGVLFNNSLRDAMEMRFAGVSQLYGAAARGRSLLLKRAFQFPPRPEAGPAREHLSNRYLAIAYALGAPRYNGEMPDFNFRFRIDELREELSSLGEHPRLLILGAGAAYGAAKRWPAEYYRTVARYWLRCGGIVAVTGSAGEAAIGNAITGGLDPKKTFNLCGKTSLGELMLILKYAAAAVSNDSGTMHLASALGVNGVAVFGPTDLTATGPIFGDWRLLYRKLACSPCFKRECPKKDARCIKSITPAMVIRELRRLCRDHRILPANAYQHNHAEIAPQN